MARLFAESGQQFGPKQMYDKALCICDCNVPRPSGKAVYTVGNRLNGRCVWYALRDDNQAASYWPVCLVRANVMLACRPRDGQNGGD